VVVGTGSAVGPVSPLLVCAKLAQDRSDDPATLRRFKVFPSLVGLGLATVPALVVHFQERIGLGGRAPTGVSDHRDFRSASHLGGYGTLLRASLLRCLHMYDFLDSAQGKEGRPHGGAAMRLGPYSVDGAIAGSISSAPLVSVADRFAPEKSPPLLPI
jgi:hypothetical protein